MFKLYLILIPLLFIFYFSFLINPVFAHPVDQIYLDVTVTNKSPNTAVANLYLSWQQLGYILDRYGNLPAGKKQPVSDETSLTNLFKTYKEYTYVFTNYFNKNLIVKNSNKECVLDYIENPEIDEKEILVGKGYKFILNITCSNNIHDGFFVKSNLYVEEYPYQTLFIELNTDNNNYSVALNKDLSEKEVIQKIKDKSNIKSKNYSSFSFSNLQDNFYSTLKKGSLVAVILLFFIGALHTLEAGHSKAIIFSLASHRDTNFKQGLIYVLVFTITHVADILLLAGVFLFLNSTVDIYKNLPLLNKVSLIILIIISLYMLINSFKNYKNIKHNKRLFFKSELNHSNFLNKHSDNDIKKSIYVHSHGGSTHSHEINTKDTSIKKQILMGFVAGIAPCFMGWSIFLFILSTKNIYIIIPLIISFALGIATTLFIFLFLSLKLKKPLYNKFSQIGEISPIISASVLLIYAVVALFKY